MSNLTRAKNFVDVIDAPPAVRGVGMILQGLTPVRKPDWYNPDKTPRTPGRIVDPDFRG